MSTAGITGNVQIKDRNWSRILKEIKSGKRMHLAVGVYGENAKIPHHRTGKEIGEVAHINEYGVGVPTRSFLRAWVDKNTRSIKKEILRAYGRVVRDKMQRSSEKREWDRLGNKYAKKLRSTIERKEIKPPNAAATVARKGFNHPLFEDGVLLSAIDHEVRK